MELLKNISTILSIIISVCAVLTLISKGFRNLITRLFKSSNNDITKIKESVEKISSVISVLEEHSKQQCRDTIKDIYYKYYEKKKIPLYERKTADKTYDLYVHKFNGNSYVELLYSEIIKWEIDTSYLDIEKDDDE